MDVLDHDQWIVHSLISAIRFTNDLRYLSKDKTLEAAYRYGRLRSYCSMAIRVLQNVDIAQQLYWHYENSYNFNSKLTRIFYCSIILRKRPSPSIWHFAAQRFIIE